MDKNSLIKKDERLDDLEYNGLRLIQNPNWYSFSSDAVLLANISKARKTDVVVDFGTGNGVVAILVAAKTNAKKVIGIELQTNVAELASRNVDYNELKDKVEILNIDISKASEVLGKESVNVVVCNPPYFGKNSGEKSTCIEKAISRQESTCDLNDIIKSASQILKYSGKLYMIHKSERMAEVMASMVNNNIMPKKLTLIYPKISKNVDTFIIEGQKCGSCGLIIEKLVVYNEDGSMTEEAKKLYNKN